jgi:hypothetical protein
MQRFELFEIEDFKWFPKSLRNGVTQLLEVLHQWLHTPDVVANILEEEFNLNHNNIIVDIGSGSGGAMPAVLDKINSKESLDCQLILTDLYPNITLINHYQNHAKINYHHLPINGNELEKAPDGIYTLMACFHHFNPRQALKILDSAQSNKKSILIYEIAINNVPFLVWLFLLPISMIILFLMALLMTPFVKQKSLTILLFTYLIPIIPIIYAWDGQASLKRTYTFKDIDELLKKIPSEADYTWQYKVALDRKGSKKGYYIIGQKNT